jgi:two-component system, OmpR family, phosphate regulon response regulator PhoB
MGQPRVVIIKERPLIERLVTLFERPEEASSTQGIGECVCEAHLLAPNLILLELTGAGVTHVDARKGLHEEKSARDVPIFKLAVAKSQRGRRAEATGAEEEQPLSVMTGEDQLLAREPVLDSSTVTAVDLEPVLQIGPVRIDRHGHWAYLDDRKLHLTPTEFRLLECFLREPGRAFTRSQLLDVSIGNASFVLERTIDVHIRSLRMKLGTARELIETVRGVGYRFRENQPLPQ